MPHTLEVCREPKKVHEGHLPLTACLVTEACQTGTWDWLLKAKQMCGKGRGKSLCKGMEAPDPGQFQKGIWYAFAGDDVRHLSTCRRWTEGP